jgi:hypothetical protein
MGKNRFTKLSDINYALRAQNEDQHMKTIKRLQDKDLLDVDKIIHLQLPNNKYL